MILSGTIQLFVVAVCLRILGEYFGPQRSPLATGISCFLVPAATWTGLSGLGFTTPIVIVLAAGVGLIGVTSWIGRLEWTKYLADGVLLAVTNFFSVPQPDPLNVVAAGVLLIVLWYIVSWLIAGAGGLSSLAAVVSAAVMLVGGYEFWTVARSVPLIDWSSSALYMSAAPACKGDRVQLNGKKGIAWYDKPSAHEAAAAALVLHGADARGSQQPSACVLRRVLVASGYPVLALDHIGYGASAVPDSTEPITAWDPLRPAQNGLRWLRSETTADSVVVVGHSMGTVTAMRLSNEDSVSHILLFGAALTDFDSSELKYWYRRFHQDRDLAFTLPFTRYDSIRKAYYSSEAAVATIDSGHPPVIVARVGHEWPNLLEGQRALYRQLPPEKSEVFLPHATHYFSSLSVTESMLFYDWRSIRDLEKLFERLSRSIADPSGDTL